MACDGYPIINGDGSVPYDSKYKVRKDHVYSPAVLLSDQSNWVIDGIEVTNSADDNFNHVGIPGIYHRTDWGWYLM